MIRKECNRNILKKAITKLPWYALTNDTIWESLEKKLEGRKDKLPDLPEHTAPEGLWDKIESRLAGKNKKPGKSKIRTIPLRTKIAVAAGILIMIGLGILQLTGKFQQKTDVAYSVESISPASGESVTADDEIQESLNTLLTQQCKNNARVCASIEFKDLQRELQKIDREYDELKSQIIKSRDNHLYQYLYRIENERIIIQKELLQMLKAS